MGLEVQPYNYTFSLLPWNCKRSILTFKTLGWLGLGVHLGNQSGRQVHKAFRGTSKSVPAGLQRSLWLPSLPLILWVEEGRAPPQFWFPQGQLQV